MIAHNTLRTSNSEHRKAGKKDEPITEFKQHTDDSQVNRLKSSWGHEFMSLYGENDREPLSAT